jgi:hypothetical protein
MAKKKMIIKQKKEKTASTSTAQPLAAFCCTRRLFNPKQLPFTYSNPLSALAQLVPSARPFLLISSLSLRRSNAPTEHKGQEVMVVD